MSLLFSIGACAIWVVALTQVPAPAQPQPDGPGADPVISEVSLPKEARPGDILSVTWRVRAESEFQPFTVVGASDDQSPPAVSDVVVDPENPKPGDTLTISWRARDESGVLSIMPWATGPNGRLVDEQGVFWMDSADGELVDGTPEDGTYRIELPLSEMAAAGQYRIWFSIADVIGNRDTTFSVEPAITFEVTDSRVTEDP